MCSVVSISPTVAQTEGLQRVAMQDARPKAKVPNRRPLDSDASYVCTLSGFGNLAHCYPR